MALNQHHIGVIASSNQSVSSSFTDPTDIDGLILWWDADYSGNTINTTTSDTFSDIVDRSATGNDLIQATKTNQPDVVVVDGVNMWQCNGTDNFMQAAEMAFMSSETEYTVFIVNSCSDALNISLEVSNTSGTTEYLSIGSRPDSSAVGYSGLTFPMYSNSSGITDWLHADHNGRHQKLVGTIRNNGSTSTTRINSSGSAVVEYIGSNQGNLPNDAGVTFNRMKLGQLQTLGTTYWRTNKCGDVLVYSASLTDEQCGQIEDYLMDKHSITPLA